MKISLKNKLKAMLMVGGATFAAPAAMTATAYAESESKEKSLSPQIANLLDKYGDAKITLKMDGKVYKGRASDIKKTLQGEELKDSNTNLDKSEKLNTAENKTKKSSTTEDETKKVLELVNKERKKVGLKPLKYDSEMEKVANIRAKELEKKWSHTRPDGRAWNTAHKRLNGENLSKGYNDPEKMVNAWMNSPSHRKNLLNPRYKSLGMGKHVTSNGTVFWAQSFSYN